MKKNNSGQSTPLPSEFRAPTRRAAKIMSYNEDDSHGLSDEDSENIASNQTSYVEDVGPAIDQVLNHKLKEGVGTHPYSA